MFITDEVFSMRVIYTIIFFLYATCSFADNSYADAVTGFSFPQKIGSFIFDEKKVYDDKRLGYGLNYRSASGILISIFVYNYGIKDIQNGTEGAHVVKQYEQAHNDVKRAVDLGYYKSATPLSSPVRFSPSFLVASYSIVSKNGTQKRSHLFIRGQNGNFIKVRATGPNRETIDTEISDFLDRLLKIIG